MSSKLCQVMGYLADVHWQKKVFSHCYNPVKQAKRLTALLQQKGSASASAVQKSRRAEHAAELSTDLTVRHLLQGPEIKGNSFPSLVPLGLGFQRLPFGSHTHVPCFHVYDTQPLPPSHRQLNNRKQIVHQVSALSEFSIQAQSLPFLPGIHTGNHARRC